MNQPPHRDFDQQRYRHLLTSAVAALKGGDRQEAVHLLERAIALNPADSQPYLWLSATSDDPAVQRDYLEQALAIDPNNSAARRGLVLLTHKEAGRATLKEGQQIDVRAAPEPVKASGEVANQCPRCGGRMRFEADRQALTCQYCGHVQSVDTEGAADSAEQVLEMALTTLSGHRWAASQQQTACTRCGAVTLLAPQEELARCPYCASDQLVKSAETADLLDPEVLGLPELDEAAARQALEKWLGTGWTSPDDLHKVAGAASLQMAYYPFFTFDGTLEMHWVAEVNEGTSRNPHWVGTNGIEFEMFDDMLVPGLKALDASLLPGLLPFKLKEVKAFQPAFLAGWKALRFDIPLADASLKGREQVIRKLRRELRARIAEMREMRNLRQTTLNWSGMTYKYVLLPLWVGSYQFDGQPYPFMINAQTGKVSGQRPRDSLKVVGLAVIALLVTLLLGLAGFTLALSLGWISL